MPCNKRNREKKSRNKIFVLFEATRVAKIGNGYFVHRCTFLFTRERERERDHAQG